MFDSLAQNHRPDMESGFDLPFPLSKQITQGLARPSSPWRSKQPNLG